jgi:hypothetical protein
MKFLLFLLCLGCLFPLSGHAEPVPEGMSLEQFREYLAINPYKQEPVLAFAARVGEEENDRLQAHYLAICYMGFWLQGDVDKAKLSYATLKKEQPSSELIERLNPERMLKTCTACSRVRAKKEFCSICKGTNLCPTCKGKKSVVRMGGPKPCAACNGTGRCTVCDRQGRVVKPAGSCMVCGGTKKVFNRDRGLLVYKRLLEAEQQDIINGKQIRFWARDPGVKEPQSE